MKMGIDPVCLFHGKRQSEHRCVVCTFCYKDLPKDEDCNLLPSGEREDVCHECAAAEKAAMEAKEKAR